jgi:hypothetical protein
MNVLEIQNTLKDLSDNQLVQEMRAPSGSAPQYLVLSEIQRRKEMRAGGGKNTPMPESTIAEQYTGELQGGPQQQAPAPQDVPGMRDGGRVGYAEGGPVGSSADWWMENYGYEPWWVPSRYRARKSGLNVPYEASRPYIPGPGIPGPIPGAPAVERDRGSYTEPGSGMPRQPREPSFAERMKAMDYGTSLGPSEPLVRVNIPIPGTSRAMPEYVEGGVSMRGPSGPPPVAPESAPGPLGEAYRWMTTPIGGRRTMKTIQGEPVEVGGESYTDPRLKYLVPGGGGVDALRAAVRGEDAPVADAPGFTRRRPGSAEPIPEIIEPGTMPGSGIMRNLPPDYSRMPDIVYDDPQAKPPTSPGRVNPNGSGASNRGGSGNPDTSPATSGTRAPSDAAGGLPAKKTLADYMAELQPYQKDYISPLTKELDEQRGSIKKDKSDALNYALIQAGLGMMSSKNPTVLGALGEGGLGALQGYQASLKDARNAERDIFRTQATLAGAQQSQHEKFLELASKYGFEEAKRILENEKLGIERTKVENERQYRQDYIQHLRANEGSAWRNQTIEQVDDYLRRNPGASVDDAYKAIRGSGRADTSGVQADRIDQSAVVEAIKSLQKDMELATPKERGAIQARIEELRGLLLGNRGMSINGGGGPKGVTYDSLGNRVP